MIKSLVCLLVVCGVAFASVEAIEKEVPIFGFHFHTYFFQNNKNHQNEALKLRSMIEEEIRNGTLTDCALNHLNMGPRGPHPIGSWETCCNISSVSNGVSFFMKHRGRFNVLLHPLTKSEVIDHTERAFWLGQRMSLDTSVLESDLPDFPTCPKYY